MSMQTANYEGFLNDIRVIFSAELDAQLIPRFQEQEERIDRKFQKLEERFTKQEERIDRKFQELEERFTKLEERQTNLEDSVNRLELGLNRTNRRLENLDIRVSCLELSMKRSEKAIRTDIAKLKDATETLTAVLETKGILPLMQ